MAAKKRKEIDELTTTELQQFLEIKELLADGECTTREDLANDAHMDRVTLARLLYFLKREGAVVEDDGKIRSGNWDSFDVAFSMNESPAQATKAPLDALRLIAHPVSMPLQWEKQEEPIPPEKSTDVVPAVNSEPEPKKKANSDRKGNASAARKAPASKPTNSTKGKAAEEEQFSDHFVPLVVDSVGNLIDQYYKVLEVNRLWKEKIDLLEKTIRQQQEEIISLSKMISPEKSGIKEKILAKTAASRS